MFTGIVEELGRVESFDGTRLRITATTVLEGSGLGDSIAVNGCCLTLVEQGPGWWEADVSAETRKRTVLDDLRGTPPSAIVLMSDGINTDGETLVDAAAYARRKNVPLFALALGSEDPIRNLKLHDLLVDEVVFVDDVVHFEFKLTGSGFEGKTVNVALKKKGDSAELANVQVRVGADNQPQDVRLPYRPTEVGEFEYAAFDALQLIAGAGQHEYDEDVHHL